MKNLDRVRAQKRSYYEANRERLLLNARKRYDNNPDVIAKRRRQQIYYERGEYRDSVGRRPYRMFVRGQRELPSQVEKDQRKAANRRRKKEHDRMFKRGLKWCRGCGEWHPIACFADNRRERYKLTHTKPVYPTYGKYPNCRDYERKAKRQRWLKKVLIRANPTKTTTFQPNRNDSAIPSYW